PDGSYSAFGPRQENGSIWLTAFVVKSFAQASSYIFIDKQLQTDSGDFDFSPEMQRHPANVVWSQYKSFPMDLTGDGKMDILWVAEGGTVSMFAAVAR
ncbi:MAG: hypothetical protein AAF696_20505, partial [Bacteroidota bacterium]